MLNNRYVKGFLCVFVCLLGLLACKGEFSKTNSAVASSLQVVIIRHGEKPQNGDVLSCQGFNRSIALKARLKEKIGLPAHIYVPTLTMGKSTKHLRMLQTVLPFATANNLAVNTDYAVDKTDALANHLKTQNGVELVVWEHKAIPELAKSLGVKHVPKWSGDDFDGMWTITFKHKQATLNISSEGLSPQPNCD
jgi:hypothetical protein